MHKIRFHHFSTNLLHIFKKQNKCQLLLKTLLAFIIPTKEKQNHSTALNLYKLQGIKNGSKMREKTHTPTHNGHMSFKDYDLRKVLSTQKCKSFLSLN